MIQSPSERTHRVIQCPSGHIIYVTIVVLSRVETKGGALGTVPVDVDRASACACVVKVCLSRSIYHY